MASVTNTQTRFEEALADVLHSIDLRLTIDKSYSNVGTYTITTNDSFVSLFSVAFDWVDGDLKLTGEDVLELSSPYPLIGITRRYTRNHLDALLNDIKRVLTEGHA